MRGRNLSFLVAILILIAVSAYLSLSGNQILAATASGPCKVAGEKWSYDANNNLPPFDCCPDLKACPDGYCCEVESEGKPITGQITGKASSQPTEKTNPDQEPVETVYTCYQDLDCGPDGWVGNSYCRNEDVYQLWRTYTCDNPGTLSSCSHDDQEKKKQECGETVYGDWSNPYCKNQDVWQSRDFTEKGCLDGYCFTDTGTSEKGVETCFECSDGECIDGSSVSTINENTFTCYQDSDCGTNGWIGNPYCRNGDVYQKWRIYTCQNPGTEDSYCSHSDQGKKKQDCEKGCSEGECYTEVIILSHVCYNDSDCGTDGWLGQEYCCYGGGDNDDVCDIYRTYTCHKPGTPSAYCTHTDTDKVKKDCGDTECEDWGDPYCYQGDVWHERSCTWRGCDDFGCYVGSGTDDEKVEECGSYECSNGQCNFECYEDSDCGANGWVGDPYCKDNDVYQLYRTYECNNPGTIDAQCYYTDEEQKKEECGTAGCSNGHCKINCNSDSDCGTNEWVGNPYCKDSDVYQLWRTYTCQNPGTKDSYCSHDDQEKKKEECGAAGCSNGKCNTGTIACYKDSDCGTNEWTGNPYCQGGDVWQKWRTYKCNNPGTVNSYCSQTDQDKKKEDCGDKACKNGGCVGGDGDLPDLRASNLRVMWPPNPKAGEITSFEFIIKNTGKEKAENIKFKLLTGESNWNPSWPIILDVGEEIYISYDHTYSNLGTYTVTAIVDPGNQIKESDENNNKMSIIIVVS